MNNRLIKSNDAEAGGCTNTVDLYNPFPDGGGVALYQLNGDATDVSGNYDGTASNVTYGAGQFGQAGVFNGSSSYVQLPSLINFGLSSYTISLWFKVSNVNVFQSLFSTYGTPNNQGIIISQQSNGTVRFYASGGQTIAIATSELTVADTWYNVVCTMVHKGQARIYLNGELQNEYSAGTGTIGSDAGANPNIGRTPSGIAYTNGSIDQVRIFNRELRPYEVEALYTEEYCTPTIVPSEHFNTVLYTGNSSTQNITGVGFQPDLVWIKRRNTTEDHAFFDSVRGALKMISSNLTTAEYTTAAPYEAVSSFDSDGFTTGDNGATNRSPNNYVAWNFKAGGSAVTNTDGTITSQVSANTEAGFSIVKWTGTGANATIGHGLSDEPKFIITKNTNNGAENWNCWHTGLSGNGYRIILNQSASEDGTSPTVWNNNINPTPTTFSLGSADAANGLSNAIIAYCFAEVEGFSNFGSYIGTGNTVNVVTGFEPAMIIIKRTDSTEDWKIIDNKRGFANSLEPNESIAEEVGNNSNFILSDNGFTIGDPHGDYNANGGKYIYMAFAADPTTIEPSLEDSFNTVTYTGNGGTQSITGVGFQPDLVWTKGRTVAYDHGIQDSVRGVNSLLYPSVAEQETITSAATQSFDSDGFTYGSNNKGNASNSTYVAWAWKGAEIPAINSNGSIPSVVSANPAAGFSISTYSGKTGGGTTGHGLNSEPEFIIFKRYTATQNWFVFAKINNVWHSFEGLNTTAAAINYSAYFSANDSIINWYNANEYNSDPASSYLAYSFHSVAGFSKFGSYSANASGVSVTTDFEPAFVMVKSTTSSHSWYMIDNKRGSTSPNSVSLFPNLSNAEASGYGIYFNSTGFTVAAGVGNGTNGGGNSYIYMAFANQF